MHSDHQTYFKFTSKARIDKSINSLLGIVEGIAIDGVVNSSEVSFLNLWLSEHADVQDQHPFNELVPVVQSAIADGILTQDEHDDIVWLCEKLRSTEYFDKTTADLQRLHGILGSIIADGIVTEDELLGLKAWLQAHEHLRTCWPYDEVDSLITGVMRDHVIDDDEQKMLKTFFSEFVTVLDEKTITNPLIAETEHIIGLCAVCPEIEFEGSKFCFTGASTKYTRASLESTVERLGGEVMPSVNKHVRYLVIGAEGNPCWAYACYGRKVEKAVELRKQGVRVLIVHENDFHDAVADAG